MTFPVSSFMWSDDIGSGIVYPPSCVVILQQRGLRRFEFERESGPYMSARWAMLRHSGKEVVRRDAILRRRAFAWPLLIQAGGRAQLSGWRLELTPTGRTAFS